MINLSVIIPCYNEADSIPHFLIKCRESLIKNTDRDYLEFGVYVGTAFIVSKID
jgi:glycosyltransferase involved in cell wall biosynthesis|tara:strand:+ start:2183 stop:2344 length:162 start_codon:yes stop_codon:yes gene_type:complete